MEQSIKGIICRELRGIFIDHTVEDVLPLYEAVAKMETTAETAIRSTWMENISDFYSFSENMETNHKFILNFEGFLKKVLYLINETEYNNCKDDNKKCLYSVMENLGLFRNIPKNTNVSTCDPEKFTNPINRAVVWAYQMRNETVHNAEALSVSEMLSNVKNVMLTTIDAVWRNRALLENKINKVIGESQFGIETLMKKIVSDYEGTVRDGFTYVPLLWESDTKDFEEVQSKAMRIDELLEDHHILLAGDAGCGKTTSLENLEYQAAKRYLSNQSSAIPVNIALINESIDSSLQEMICRKLNISISYCEQLLEKGSIYLLIDGLNEYTTDIERKKALVTSIEKLFSLYPKVFVALTDRRYSPYPVRVNKTYHLKRMDKENILKYAETKSESNKNVLGLLEEILDSNAFGNLEFTPLLVNQLIMALSSSGVIPADLTELIGMYLEALFKREYVDKRVATAAPGKLDVILMGLALAKEDEGGGINYYRALRVCAETAHKYGINLESDACLTLAIQMGILTRMGDQIDFVLSNYRTYYLLKAADSE